MQEKRAGNQCVKWLRSELKLTQNRLAILIGARQPTIQAIEIGRLQLSEHFAFALERITGISHQWLLDNTLETPPVTPAGRAWDINCFTQAEAGEFSEAETMHLFPRMQLVRVYVLLRSIVDELGYKGVQASGFNAILQKAVLDLLATIADKKVRDQVYTRALKITGVPGNEGTLKLMMLDAKELLRVSREQTARHLQLHDAVASRAQTRSNLKNLP